MIISSYRAESSQSSFPSSQQTENPPYTQTCSDTLSSSKKTSAWIGLGGLCLDFFSYIWEVIKYNLLFCVFDEEEETREKLLKELEGFVNRTPFGQHDPDQQPELYQAKDFLPAFKSLNPKLQTGILDEMVVILRELKFDIDECKKHYRVNTENEAFQKFAEALLELPYDDIQDLVPENKELDSHIVVFEAIRSLDLKLRSYESY